MKAMLPAIRTAAKEQAIQERDSLRKMLDEGGLIIRLSHGPSMQCMTYRADEQIAAIRNAYEQMLRIEATLNTELFGAVATGAGSVGELLLKARVRDLPNHLQASENTSQTND
jgi:hypothetical protein